MPSSQKGTDSENPFEKSLKSGIVKSFMKNPLWTYGKTRETLSPRGEGGMHFDQTGLLTLALTLTQRPLYENSIITFSLISAPKPLCGFNEGR